MYAVFSTGGKQYRASTGDLVTVEKLEAEKGSTIALDKVLMVGEGESVQVGTPFLAGGKVTAKVVEHGRGDKIKIVKFKRRKHYMRTQGHRQYFTTLEITGIDGARVAPATKADEQAPADKPVAKKKAAAKKAPAKKAASKKAAAKKTASKKTAAKKTAAKAKAAEDKGGE
jgi:large subunit ribosomal protein L21